MGDISEKEDTVAEATTEPTIEELLQKHVLTVPEVARILDVNHKTVRLMIAQGELHAVRVRRNVRIPILAVLSLTKQDRVVPPRSSSHGGET